MKTLVSLFVVSTLLLTQASAQYTSDDRKDDAAKKKIVKASRTEWEAAMNQYKNDMAQNAKATDELGLLKYQKEKSNNYYDQVIADKENRRAPYQATLDNEKETNQVAIQTAKDNLERLNADIEELKKQKAKDEADVDAKIAEAEKVEYKPVDQIEKELADTKDLITTRLAPYKATGDKADRLGYVFIHQDMKYNGLREQYKSDSQFAAKKYLDKKYPPTNMFKSDVTEYYSQKSDQAEQGAIAARFNKKMKIQDAEKTPATKSQNPEGIATTTNTRSLPGIPSKVTFTTATKNTNTTETAKSDVQVIPTQITSKDPATVMKIATFNQRKATEHWDTKSVPNDPKLAKETTATTTADTSKCDRAEVEVVQAILKDPRNASIFSKMVKMSTLKMAYNLSNDATKKKSIEEYANTLNLSQTKTDETFQANVKQMYETYGAATDKESLQKLGDVKKGSYGNSSTRFTNDNASALALYMAQKSDKNDPMAITVDDAANIWAQQKVFTAKNLNIHQKNNEQANLLNFSTQVYHTLNFNTSSRAEMKARYEKTNSEVQSALTAAVKSISDPDGSKKACFKDAASAPCDTNSTSIGTESVSKIQKKLTQLVSRGTASVSDVNLDLDLKSGVVTKNGVIQFKNK